MKALHALNEQEKQLRLQKERIEAEVNKLQQIVNVARAELQLTEAEREDAGKRLEEAATAVRSDYSHEEQDDTHIDPTDTTPAEVPVKKKCIILTRPPSAKLGLFFSNGTPEITRVFPGMAGDQAGLRTGMIIRKVNTVSTATLAELDARLAQAGERIVFEVDVEVESDDSGSEGEREGVGGEDMEKREEEPEEEKVESGRQCTGTVSKEPLECQTVTSVPSVELVPGPEPVQPPPARVAPADERGDDKDYVLVSATPPPETTELVPFEGAAREGHFGVEEDTVGKLSSSAPRTEQEGRDWLPSAADIELEGFKEFCRKYAAEHPELVAPDVTEDPQEELMRLQEERRMRELTEDPLAMRGLLLHTMQRLDESRTVEKGLAAHLETDDWKKDYEERVRKKEAIKDKLASGQ